MAEIYGWVKNIIIFLVLTTIISNLLGKSSYKKYVNLITGIILVILVISPLLKLFQMNGVLDYYFSFNILSTQANDMKSRLIDTEKGQMSEILKSYKDEIKTQVGEILKEQELYIVNINLGIDEDTKSSTFGKLKNMELTASYVRQKNNKSDSTRIEDIDIDKINIEKSKEDKKKAERDSLSPKEIKIKNLLSDFYNINPNNINISIQED
jgi:stage III sporulation protein AF